MRSPFHFPGIAAASLLLLAAVVACSNTTTTATGTPTPTAIGMIGGSAQVAPVGSALTVPLQVHVTDQFGNGIAGATVTFSAGDGASVANTTVTTDANGNAQTTATLGTRTGVDSIVATIAGDNTPVRFLETVLAGAPATIAVDSGSGQTGTTGAPLPVALVVIVKDQAGNPVAGDSVTWTSATGTLAATMSITAFDGTAQVVFSPALGTNSVTASINGGALSTSFTETGN